MKRACVKRCGTKGRSGVWKVRKGPSKRNRMGLSAFESGIASRVRLVYNEIHKRNGGFTMKHIQTIQKSCLKESLAHGGCGECQASCQSACKTSCTVANQSCKHKESK